MPLTLFFNMNQRMTLQRRERWRFSIPSCTLLWLTGIYRITGCLRNMTLDGNVKATTTNLHIRISTSGCTAFEKTSSHFSSLARSGKRTGNKAHKYTKVAPDSRIKTPRGLSRVSTFQRLNCFHCLKILDSVQRYSNF